MRKESMLRMHCGINQKKTKWSKKIRQWKGMKHHLLSKIWPWTGNYREGYSKQAQVTT